MISRDNDQSEKPQNSPAVLSLTSNNVAPVAVYHLRRRSCLVIFHLCSKMVKFSGAFLPAAQQYANTVTAQHQLTVQDSTTLSRV